MVVLGRHSDPCARCADAVRYAVDSADVSARYWAFYSRFRFVFSDCLETWFFIAGTRRFNIERAVFHAKGWHEFLMKFTFVSERRRDELRLAFRYNDRSAAE